MKKEGKKIPSFSNLLYIKEKMYCKKPVGTKRCFMIPLCKRI